MVALLRFFMVALVLAPLPAWACAPGAPAPAFSLGVVTAEPQVETGKTAAELAAMTEDPEAFTYHARIGALMAGRFITTYRLSFKDEPGCVALAGIAVAVEIQPLIYMAQEHHDDACAFKAFLEHELEHVAIDEQMMRDYARDLESGVRFAYAAPADYTMKVTDDETRLAAKRNFQEQVGGVLDALLDSVMRARAEKHQAHDSAAEYARLAWACAGQTKEAQRKE